MPGSRGAPDPLHGFVAICVNAGAGKQQQSKVVLRVCMAAARRLEEPARRAPIGIGAPALWAVAEQRHAAKPEHRRRIVAIGSSLEQRVSALLVNCGAAAEVMQDRELGGRRGIPGRGQRFEDLARRFGVALLKQATCFIQATRAFCSSS